MKYPVSVCRTRLPPDIHLLHTYTMFGYVKIGKKDKVRNIYDLGLVFFEVNMIWVFKIFTHTPPNISCLLKTIFLYLFEKKNEKNKEITFITHIIYF